MARERSPSVSVNPRRIGPGNAILWGRGRRHFVENFPGPLSIKSVVRGRAAWTTRGGRFVLHEDAWLVLNDGRKYTIDVDAPHPVETFCVFFRAGFVADVRRSIVASDERLLDAPESDDPDPGFIEMLRRREPRISGALTRMHARIAEGRATPLWLDARLFGLARNLVSVEAGLDHEIARVPAARAATRQELYRRLRKARDFIEGSLDEPLDLAAIARAACLSPFHFHRRFSATFHETPHGYVVRRRLERARDLLAGSDFPVTDVALACGFESLGSFSSLFRRRFGAPPRDFRAAAQNRKIGEEPAAARRA